MPDPRVEPSAPVLCSARLTRIPLSVQPQSGHERGSEMSRPNIPRNVVGAALAVLLAGCGAPAATPASEPTVAPTLPPADASPGPELTLPPIPDMFPRTDEAECGWQQPLLGTWSRTTEDQSTETVTFKPDNTLFFTYEDKPNQVRVGTYICEHAGTLKLFSQSYVDDKPEMLVVLGVIEISFPAADSLVMDVGPANQVWTYERAK